MRSISHKLIICAFGPQLVASFGRRSLAVGSVLPGVGSESYSLEIIQCELSLCPSMTDSSLPGTGSQRTLSLKLPLTTVFVTATEKELAKRFAI